MIGHEMLGQDTDLGPDAASNPLAFERQPLLAYMGCSVLFHIGTVVVAWVGGLGWAALYGGMMMLPFCKDPPKQSIEVAVYSALPKTDKKVPERAARVKRAEGKESKVVEPPPVKQSDLAIQKPEPQPEGNVEKVDRQAMLDEIERNRMLEELLNAPEGTQDRNQTDPNGVEGLETAVLGAAAMGDPEYARWIAQIQRLMMSHFRPLTQGRTDLKSEVVLWVDPETGDIERWEVRTPSGVLAFDSAAESAVAATGQIPLPPEKYRPLLPEGISVEFVPPR
jgi:hypothetical protein